MTPAECPDAPECDCQLCPSCAEWEHVQGWHEDGYVDVCPRCACRARTPEEIADAHSPRAASPLPGGEEKT